MRKHFVVRRWSDKNSLDARSMENSERQEEGERVIGGGHRCGQLSLAALLEDPR